MANKILDSKVWKKLKNIPMKTLPEINIPDGEFLRYGNYVNGDKYADCYLVTMREKDDNGNTVFRTYIDIVQVNSAKTFDPDYTKWKSSCLVDPISGNVLESIAVLDPDDLKNWSGLQGTIYWHYKLNKEKGIIKYSAKQIKDGKEKEIVTELKVNPEIPNGCMWYDLFLVSRYLDFRKTGMTTMINPLYFKKVPIVFSFNEAGREEMKTESGKFNAIKYSTHGHVTLKLFIHVIIESFRKTANPAEPDSNFAFYVSDTPEHYAMKEHTIMGAGDYILEEIKNKR